MITDTAIFVDTILTGLQYRSHDPFHSVASTVGRPFTFQKEAALFSLALHRDLHHDCDITPLHSVSPRRFPNQRWYHMVDPRNGMLSSPLYVIA